MAQAAAAGCISCECAHNSTCTTDDLSKAAGCIGCRTLGADFCSRSDKWQVLLLPYTGAIEAVLLAAPAVFSLLVLLRATAAQAVDLESGK
jgi:hypothetical protein